MKFLLHYLIFLILFSPKLLSCTASYHEMFIKDEYYNFTNSDMVDLPRDNPLYKISGSYSAHQERFNYFEERKKKANIKAWKRYFEDFFTDKEIESMFYKKDSIKHNAAYYAQSSKYPNFAKYINFLHLQNRLAQNISNENSEKILKKGHELFEAEEKPFLKERYLYLLMRLYHHTGNYEKVEEIYVNNVLIINPQGVVKEWINALRAGSFQQRKESVKANQLYAQIFQYNKTNAHLGYYDFKVNSDEAWRELLASTGENTTKALYFFLRALKWENEPIYELKQIAQLAPKSIWFERLAYMIMQKLQYKRYDIMVHSGKKNKLFRAKIKSYKLQKKAFLEILTSLKEQSFFTLYSKLYLHVLEYNALKRKELVKLSSLANNKQKPFANLLNYIYALHQLSSNSLEAQHALYRQLKPLLPKFSEEMQISILRYTALQLSTLTDESTIEQTINKLFAENKIFRPTILQALNYANPTEFKAYIEKAKRSFFEKEIFKQTMKHLKRGDIAKILATLYLQENNFKEAQLYIRQVPTENRYSPYNPFNVTLSSNNRGKGQASYSQRKFVETMLRLESLFLKKPKSAKDHFLYANGLYNKSWFGNFPMSSMLYRSTIISSEHPPSKNMDLTQAKKHYELALKYSDDEEFQAKIAYQLLKIKFNQALIKSFEYNKDQIALPTFGDEENGTNRVIQLLQNSKEFTEAIRDYKIIYDHTDFAEEVIENCITFRYF
ncbi:MAG TPA: hypothetical protein ENK95_01275 [Campylobacterales bacterium]|nr:hypothetical protein [Campylobacterales bacterium]